MQDGRQVGASSLPPHLQQDIQRPNSAPVNDGRNSAPAKARAQPHDGATQSSSNPQRFLGWAKTLVKDRKGQILSRNMILKTGQ